MDSADLAVRLFHTIALGGDIQDAGVPVDAAALRLWSEIEQSLASAPAGTVWDVPTVHTGSVRTAVTKLLVPSVVKVGPKGYIHGWIYVGPQIGMGDVLPSHDHHTLGSVTITSTDAKSGLATVKDNITGKTFQIVHHHDSTADWLKAKPQTEPHGKCRDHCGKYTKGGNYLPGHDAKHVGMLAAAVQSGEVDPLTAYAELSHSAKLQNKLTNYINTPKPHLEEAAKPAVPVSVADPVNAPGQDLHHFSSQTPDGRNWQTNMVAGGRGSYYQIEERPGTQPSDPFRNQRMRLLYLGDGAVAVQRNPSKSEPDTWVDSTTTTLDMLAAPHRSKVWQAAAKQLRQAEKNEKIAKAAGAFKPKPPEVPKPEVKKPAVIKPAKQDLSPAYGTTGPGRTWAAVHQSGGAGSHIEFSADPAGGPGFYARAWRVEYLGGNKARVSYLSPSHGGWEPYHTTTLAKLNHGMPGDKQGDMTRAAYDQMRRARKNELAVEKFKTQQALAKGGKQWNAVVQSASATAKVKTMFNDKSGPAPHSLGFTSDAARAKAKVAHRVAGGMKSPTSKLVEASSSSSAKTAAEALAAYRKEGPVGGSHLMFKLTSGGEIQHDTMLPNTGKVSGWTEADSPEGDRLLREAAASAMIHRWAITSNDSDAHSIAMQEAAIHEFGLSGHADSPGLKHDDPKVLALKKNEAVYRDFLRTQYELTQADLKMHGLTHITLYRGMGWAYGSTAMPGWVSALPKNGIDQTIETPPFRPLSSWAYTPGIANGFGGQVVVTATVPAESILGYPQSGFGCFNENEFVVIGNGTGQVKAKWKA